MAYKKKHGTDHEMYERLLLEQLKMVEEFTYFITKTRPNSCLKTQQEQQEYNMTDDEAEKEAPETDEDQEEDETNDKIEEMKKPKRKAAEEDESDLDSSRCVKSSLLIKSTFR